MEKKEEIMLSRLAQDIDFLRQYIVHPNKDLELRVKELEKLNEKLREICKILAEDRIVLKKKLTDKKRRLGANSEKIKELQEKLLRKEDQVVRLAETANFQKELILSLRDKNVFFEIGDKKMRNKLNRLDRQMMTEAEKRRIFLNRAVETKKVLENQVQMVKKEKDMQILDKKQLHEKCSRIMLSAEKQKLFLGHLEEESEQKLESQKKHYERIMAELNRQHVKDMIDKKTLMAVMHKKIEALESELQKRKAREKELISQFSEKLKEIFNEN
jgi:hypothetical protein